MIQQIRLLRNIGQFDSVSAGQQLALGQLVLIYAENGRGKTTLAAVLRSLATGDPLPIVERHRLGASYPPHIILNCEGVPTNATFQSGSWNRTLPEITLFDDVFVDENIHSGLAIDARHRRNLHEYILGAQGVALSQKLQDLVSVNEQHNSSLREKAAAIPESVRYGLSVDDFCALAEFRGVDTEVTATERALAAAHDQEAIGKSPLFESLALPAFDIEMIDGILGRDLADLDTAAEANVRAHVQGLGLGGEQWVSDGMQLMVTSGEEGSCPFCAQGISGSTLLTHYRGYFSQSYADLKDSVGELVRWVRNTHAGDIPPAFERAVRVAGERRQFWARFCEVPAISIDTAEIVRDWNAARESVLAELEAKLSAPLEQRVLPREAREAISVYEGHRQNIALLSNSLIASNEDIRVVQEQAVVANPQTIEADLARLRATKERYQPDIAELCSDYLSEKEAKDRAEEERKAARLALDEYRTNIFPASETAINIYLRRFNAGFRLSRVTSRMRRGGVACTYSVLINDTQVAFGGSSPEQGEPSFRNTLSSGDRSTLALAFFFSSLRQDPDLENKVVVIDDPISSLDDHRSLATVQEIRDLAARTAQVFVLSHDKRFLSRLWNRANPTTSTAIEIARHQEGSTLRPWDVSEDAFTEHDQRHLQMRQFIDENRGNQREIAQSLRPHLEGYLRVARPEQYPPGTLLGPFLNRCQQRTHQPEEILDEDTVRELQELVEYANLFHHDTNPAWETAAINDTELRGFVRRVLDFVRP